MDFLESVQAAWRLPGFLWRPLTDIEAAADIASRLRTREARFLDSARRLIYANPSSPYRRLLARAGCSFSDLEDAVRKTGLDGTLRSLRDDGVFVSFDEFKARAPVRRGELEYPVAEAEYDNPSISGGIQARTSASRSAGTCVTHDWALVGEQAANELLLYKTHGMADAPLALWLPAPPGIAGFRNLLINIKFRRPPQRWFSHSGAGPESLRSRNRMALAYLGLLSRLLGMRSPAPELLELGQASVAAQWMSQAKMKRGRAVLRAYVSSAVRVAQAALAQGLDLSGCAMLGGGEPLTEARRAYIESSGARPVARYASAEAGLIAAACEHCPGADDLHIQEDGFHLIPAEGSAADESTVPRGILITTLSPNAGKIMLNTDMGDVGVLSRRPCRCEYGRLGMEARLSGLGSRTKVTSEGMTISSAELDGIVGDLVTAAGGCPDDFHIRCAMDEGGAARICISVNPSLKGVDAAAWENAVLERLRRGGGSGELASTIWRQAGTVRVALGEPVLSPGFKLHPR